MPSTVYRGDLTEATFGHESGVQLVSHQGGNIQWTASASGDYTKITFSNGDAQAPVGSGGNSGVLNYPVGMLVGSQVVFDCTANSGFTTADDYATTGRMFTIIEQGSSTANNYIIIAPALSAANASASSAADEKLTIMPFKTPTFDFNSAYATAANGSAERVLTDQFIGIVNTIALPDTKVDLKRYHVVGLGRDVAVQVPGRFLNQGGSFEANLHNSRWLYYCLGHEVVSVPTSGTSSSNNDNKGHASTTWTVSACKPGDTYLSLTPSTGTALPKVDLNDAADNLAPGHYIVLKDDTLVDLNTHSETASNATWPTQGAESVLNRAKSHEVRRIAGLFKETNGVVRVWLDDPIQYAHAASVQVGFHAFQDDATDATPDVAGATGVLSNPVKRLLFSRTTVPSFAMEVSVRRNDAEGSESDIVDGSASDTKQLTRVFRGCKVKDFTLTADTDAALRLTTNFDAALCYTDTGRLEDSTPGDRYDAHRLFEDLGPDAAAQLAARKKVGIAKNTQKPFMFYNGTIKLAGVTLGQVVSFTLKGSTGVQQFYTINGNSQTSLDTDQVPFAGSRNPTIAVEGKTEYELDMEIVVDDPLFYHRMRRAVRNFDETITDNTDNDMIRLSFTKNTTAAGESEELDIIMDDYFITEAPLPIPEDKGPLRSTLKIMPKNIKVVAQDTLYHA